MTSQTEAAGLKIAMALSYVCGHRDELSALLDGDDVALRALEVAIGRRATNDVALTDLLDTLHTAVRGAGDPLGVYGAVSRGMMPAGVGDLNIVYRCPLQLCIGRSGHEVAESVPRCRFDPAEAALIRERLP